MGGALAPTSYLPPIKSISAQNITCLNDSINHLRSVYNPEVRGYRRHKLDRISHSPPGNQSISRSADDALTNLRSDHFERAYAIKWLTALLPILDCSNDIDDREKEIIIHNAAALLAVCAGTSSAGKVARDFVFDYHSGPDTFIPLTIQITDISLDNDNFGSVGAQTWGGSCVLSDLITEDPELFGLSVAQLNTQGSDAFRILELGAGTGLVSLTVGKLVEHLNLSINRRIEIVATDYYPRVIENLRNNIESNFHTDRSSPNVSILAYALDWSTFVLGETCDSIFEKPFDLILGADIVYEPEHAPWIQRCLLHLLRRPSTMEIPLFHLIVTKRSTHSYEASIIEKVFSAEFDALVPSLRVVDRRMLTYGANTKEEVEYIYYKIGWF